MVKMIVRPSSFRRSFRPSSREDTVAAPLARSASVRTSVSATVASKPLVGSSRISTLGSVSISTATATRLRSPPETPRPKNANAPPTGTSRARLKPSASTIASAASSFLFLLFFELGSPVSSSGSLSAAAYRTVSWTVKDGNMQSSWVTNPTLRASDLSEPNERYPFGDGVSDESDESADAVGFVF